MAPSPKKFEEAKTEIRAAEPAKPAPKKISNCFAMNQPPHPGMVPVSTDRFKDGCFVLDWQPQQMSLMVSDAPQWYAYAAKILKANMAFTAVFAFALLLVLAVNRDRRP